MLKGNRWRLPLCLLLIMKSVWMPLLIVFMELWGSSQTVVLFVVCYTFKWIDLVQLHSASVAGLFLFIKQLSVNLPFSYLNFKTWNWKSKSWFSWHLVFSLFPKSEMNREGKLWGFRHQLKKEVKLMNIKPLNNI